MGNIVTYINSQLSADGFYTRFQKTQQGGTTTSDATATYGLQITPGANETISLSAASTPALYMVGNSGNASEVNTTSGTGTNAQVNTTAADQTGRLTKIGDLGRHTHRHRQRQSGRRPAAPPRRRPRRWIPAAISMCWAMPPAISATRSTRARQDVYLTKYDSAGNVVWQNLVGSAGSASRLWPGARSRGRRCHHRRLDTPISPPPSVADGNNDSFVASYDANGNQTWIQQIQTLATNQANASASTPAATSISAAQFPAA